MNDVLVYFEFKHLVMFDYYDNSNYTCYATKEGFYKSIFKSFFRVNSTLSVEVVLKHQKKIESPTAVLVFVN